MMIFIARRFSFLSCRLYGLEIRVRQHQPLLALALEVYLYLSVAPLSLQVQDHALAEFAVAHALAEPDAARRRFFLDPAAARHVNRPRDLDARPHFLEQLRGNLANEARWRAVAVDAVQAPLLRVR